MTCSRCLALWRVCGLLLMMMGVSLLAPAQAAEARRYAVVSLIADRLEVVSYVEQTSSRMDQHVRQDVRLKDNSLDRAFVVHSGKVLAQIDPQARLTLLAPSGSDAYGLQEQWLAGNNFTAPDWLKQDLRNESVTHLVVLLKHRGAAEMNFDNGKVGSGTLEGLGYYLDGSVETVIVQSGQRRRGFVAPYAYFRMILVDVADWRVLRRIDVTASQAVSAARNQDNTDPWGALSQGEKIQLLASLVAREVQSRMADLIKSP